MDAETDAHSPQSTHLGNVSFSVITAMYEPAIFAPQVEDWTYVNLVFVERA